jgi:L-asparaginase
MRNSSDPYSDGPFNLYNAVLQVLSKNARNWGVTVTLNQYINAARDVIKSNTTNPQTFVSGAKGYLGYLFNGKVYRLNNTLYKMKFPIPDKIPNVYIFQDYPGARDEVLRFMVDNGADGIIVEGLGSGNVNANVFKGVQYALSKNVIVIITSVVPHGGVFPIYGDVGGGEDLQKAGAIFSRFLRADKARILLLLALPAIGKNKKKLSEYFNLP